MAASGQTLSDRLNAFRYALAGQGLARTVCKATTLEVLAPKRKHMDYLIACTNEPNISIPQLANLLIERTQHSNWAVVFKALISIHHLMSYGNERFTQYLATSNHTFELPDFLDRTSPQGYNMSSFVRRYAKYVDLKSTSYRTLAIDLCKIKSGNDNALRTMNMDNLSKSIPILQKQFDALLEFGAEAKDLNNGIIMSAFRLLYKDLVRIYVAYQEAIINLLERYFKLSRKKTREALEMYKNYLARMDKVESFLRVVEAVELDKSEMPDLTNSPGRILMLLEQHLAQLEARKKGASVVCDLEETEREAENDSPQPQPQETVVRTGEDTVNAKATEESSSSNKQMPPPKPARPSPRASPAVSPKSSPVVAKPAPPRPAPGGDSSPRPDSSANSNPNKRGPPERPAKPPSRPPPPSTVVPDMTATEAKNVPSSSTQHHAPPHPQPPTTSHQLHLNPTSRNSSPSNRPESTPSATDDTSVSSQQSPVAAQRELNGASIESAPASSRPPQDEQPASSACGSTVNADDSSHTLSQAIAQDASQSEVRDQVQMNNLNHHPTQNGHEEELPSPPVALEEEAVDEGPVEARHVEPQGEAVVVEDNVVEATEPATNGESGRDEQTD